MRARSRPDDRVAEAAQRRLEALVAELGGHPRVRSEPTADQRDDAEESDEPDEVGETEDPDLRGRHARRPLPGPQRAASWAGDRLPAPFIGLRVGGRHLAVVGVLLVIGVLLAGWSYLRATQGPVGDSEVVAPRASGGVVVGSPASGAATPSGPASSSPASSGPAPDGPAPSGPSSATGAAAQAEVVVDVKGKVRRPGIAVLPAGSRVVDALEAAGGARSQADLRDLNLARLLVDGEQLLVGLDPPAGVAAGTLAGPSAAPGSAPGSGTAPAGSPVVLVNINTADQTTLETLPGVGPVTAAAILQWRTDHGAFTSVDELLEVSGIGDATLAEIAPHVTL